MRTPCALPAAILIALGAISATRAELLGLRLVEYPGDGSGELELDDGTLTEGRGHYVGTVLSLVPLSGNWWGEGEVKFFIDGDQEFPTISGTGAEDYFGSAWGIGEFLPVR